MLNKKYYNINFVYMKFVSVLLIIVMHASLINSREYLFYGAYIYVDFLFILIGFNGFNNNNLHMIVIKKLSAWLPYVFIQSIILFFIFLIKDDLGLKSIINNSLKLLFDITFLTIFLKNTSWFNGTMWFLQATLWVTVLITIIRKKINLSPNKEFFIFLIFSIILYTNIYLNVGHLDIWWQTNIFMIIVDAFPRTIAAMSLGIALKLYSRISTFKIFRFNKLIRTTLSILLFLLSMFLTFMYGWTSFDFLLILIFVFIILIEEGSEKICINSISLYLNEIMFFIYLMQVISNNVIKILYGSINSVKILLIYLLLDFVLANIMYFIKLKFENEIFQFISGYFKSIRLNFFDNK